MPDPINIPNNTEIDQALKQFEAESNQTEHPVVKAIITPQTPKIPDKETPNIEYEEDKWKQKIQPSPVDETPKMVKLVIKSSGGSIKDRRQAEYVLLGFVVVVIAISLYLMFFDNRITPPIKSITTPDVLPR